MKTCRLRQYVSDTIDRKTVSTLSGIADRFESSFKERGDCKNEEELAGVIFDLLLDDDGSVKDFGHAAEIRGLIDEAWKQQERGIANLGEIIKSVPTSVKAELGEEDRKRLDSNFKSWKDVFRLYLPTFGIVGAIIGIVLTGCIMLSNSASDAKREYEQRISQLERWYEDNADAVAFGQFYRENYPKQYRQWHTGQWQQDIAYRDSLRRAHSFRPPPPPVPIRRLTPPKLYTKQFA